MTRFFANANYDFIGFRKYAYGLTAAILVPGLIFLAIFGLHYSIEFTGGTLVQVRDRAAGGRGAAPRRPRRPGHPGRRNPEFRQRPGLHHPGAGGQGRHRRRRHPGHGRRGVGGARRRRSAPANYTILNSGGVGPKVGAELRSQALLAILLSFVAVLAYLAWRFEWRFGLAAVGATAHDILATLVFIAVMRIEVSLVVVGAVLSMVGYSLNDTIIIFDRVREDLHKYKRDDFASVLNRAINETLPRSVLTHATTLATLHALAILGGEVIRPFALVMFFGVFTGTFSSIYIAAPLLLVHRAALAGRRRPGRQDERTARRVHQGPADRLTPCWSTPTATSATRPSPPTAPR